MSDTDDEAARARRVLSEIAHALDMPLEAFFSRVSAERRGPSEAEEQELIGLFRSIRDPSKRRQCLDLLRTMAGPPGV
ncbi:hypothetical protein Q8W71_32615 [Methylobacterium sp. NEAU 140]|uniref:hypothetical protein n=1 Tax=Methylobacterium sp. NEAU 140 TaxID=3064945 RepID=UPI0027363497|nr:hypothetical protein [Methylobacterium sp. NEAU 140]MDP4026348.1 hypothetical protein [Methylobacterium sp. NEAU 140]MDP4026821.1 hypothetical protein [Methylobacterium sp. NEAU 140]MDP4027285.1 hypothetical protein [Methylobacterium sp. NEAU 140]MDP4027307.1 hypothetical protein [Methylobacterium sp. NEAU 140]